jgi:hypothetical protein
VREVVCKLVRLSPACHRYVIDIPRRTPNSEVGSLVKHFPDESRRRCAGFDRKEASAWQYLRPEEQD